MNLGALREDKGKINLGRNFANMMRVSRSNLGLNLDGKSMIQNMEVVTVTKSDGEMLNEDRPILVMDGKKWPRLNHANGGPIDHVDSMESNFRHGETSTT